MNMNRDLFSIILDHTVVVVALKINLCIHQKPIEVHYDTLLSIFELYSMILNV